MAPTWAGFSLLPLVLLPTPCNGNRPAISLEPDLPGQADEGSQSSQQASVAELWDTVLEDVKDVLDRQASYAQLNQTAGIMLKSSKMLQETEKPSPKSDGGKSADPLSQVRKWLHNIRDEPKEIKLECGQDITVTGLGFDGLTCRPECSYLAELNRVEGPGGCHFRCVPKEECGNNHTDTLATIPDKEMKYCRRCNLPGCDKCILSDHDVCMAKKCRAGYFWSERKDKCKSVGEDAFTITKGVLLVIIIFLLMWYADIRLLRSQPNQDGVEHGLGFREATKLVRPKADGEEETGELYPLCINLHSTDNSEIGGPGNVLHFNFQLAIILWSGILAIAWYIFAMVTEHELLELGRKPAVTPAQFCGVLHWGHRLQYRMMWVKVAFIAGAYAFTTLGSIIYSAMQLRRFARMDDVSTMKDYMALVKGLPTRNGSDLGAESETKGMLEEMLGQELIGVSLCWNYTEAAGVVEAALEADLMEAEEAFRIEEQLATHQQEITLADGGSGGTPTQGGLRGEEGVRARSSDVNRTWRRGLLRIDDFMFWLCGGAPVDEAGQGPVRGDEGRERLKEVLSGLQTTDIAFAVFKSEDCRDRAVAASEAVKGFTLSGHPHRITLQEEQVEPESVMFHNFGHPEGRKMYNITIGVLIMVFSNLVWGALFYLPYAYYVAAFTYAHGDEPDGISATIFSLLVVIGNQVMYFICAAVADSAGFQFVDYREAFYTVLYTLACGINVLVDLMITGWLAYKSMITLGVHTGTGELLANLNTLHDIVEAFSMQKSLGNQIWLYNFPSSFLVPFIVEPIFAIGLFRHLMVVSVRAHGDLSTRQCEQALAIFVPMDLGRYADVLVNAFLAVCALFCAPGYIHYNFGALCCCHTYIIVYDHYRVLRCVPGFNFSTDFIERIGQALFGVCAALMLSALVFKSNCMSDGPKQELGLYCVRDKALGVRMVVAFVGHMVLYLLIIQVLLPCCMRTRDHQQASDTYEQVARRVPCSWFSANPVHCLRSKLLHGHAKPCIFYRRGKEYLLKEDPSIGCHFRAKPRAYTNQPAKERGSSSASEVVLS